MKKKIINQYLFNYKILHKKMNPNYIIYFLFIILINIALSTSLTVNFKKYGEYKALTEAWVIFESSEFNKGDEIYFVINCGRFSDKNLLFYFFDDLSNPPEFESGKKSVEFIQRNQHYEKIGKKKYLKDEEAYFTVEKRMKI